jgi:hypothetical protein
LRARRLLAAVVTTGLIAPTAVVVASSTAPASAATATQVVSGYSNQPAVYASRKPATTGDNVYAAGYALDGAGRRVTEGTVYLQRQLAGEATWRNIAVGTTSSVIATSKAVRNANYRVYYTGSANFTPSWTPTIKINVGRKVKTKSIRGKQAGLKGNVKPAAKVKIIVQKKVGKKYKKFKTLRTNRKGSFKIILPAPRSGRSYWKITFAGSKGYSKTVWKGYTYKSF